MLRHTVALAVCAWVISGPRAYSEGQPTVRRAEPFPLDQVRLLDGPFRDAMLRNKAYLLGLKPDRLLHMFRVTAGLPSNAQPYGGWEAPSSEVRGHCLGHYLSACALTYASTGDKELKSRTDYLVKELGQCQESLPKRGYNEGYLAAFPESFFDRVEARQPVWVPWYTIHKIMAGLLDVHQSCDNDQALVVAEKMADWVKLRVDRLTFDQMQAVLDTEYGGMNEVLTNLYAITRHADHLRLAQAFDQYRLFDPLARGVDALDGLHANTQVPKMIGSAREYELTGMERYRDIAKFFWERVALHRSYVIGGHSDAEHFFPVDKFHDHLSAATAETCNTYNMLKLTRHLFSWEPSARIMDFYETAMVNHILASQDPEKGMFVYLTSLKPGHFKTYSTPEDSFWCCVGTGMENHAKYADTIYFHHADSLFVNLFIASELNWTEKGLTVSQTTQFPEDDTTLLTFHSARPVEVAVNIRCPSWATDGAILTLNGKPLEVRGAPGTYVTIPRTWQDGDQLEVRLPMSLHLAALPGVPRTIAVLYGPVVLAGQLGTDKLPTPYAQSQVEHIGLPVPQTPVFVTADGEILSRIEKVVDQPLTFRTQGLGQPFDVTLIPFYRTHHQRYSVYWPIYSPAEWVQAKDALAAAEAQRQQLESRTIDVVRPGDQQSEADHQLQGESTEAGNLGDRKWRHAVNGWFSWNLKTAGSDTRLVLRCTYWGSDEGRSFDILIDGQKIATETLNRNKPDEFFDREYPIPPDLLRDKQVVTVRFQPAGDGLAGGVFGCGIYRPAK
jgi:DUF1680 family protein